MQSVNTISNIKIYPQIFCYRKSVIDNFLTDGTITAEPVGYYFGIEQDGTKTATFRTFPLNSMNIPQFMIGITVATGITPIQTLNYGALLTSRNILDWLNYNDYVIDLFESLMPYTFDTDESDIWKVITPVSKEEDYIVPYISDMNSDRFKFAMRLRYVVIVEYINSNEEAFIVPFPQTAFSQYETILNAENQVKIIDGGTDFVKTNLRIFDDAGAEITIVDNAAEVTSFPYYIAVEAHVSAQKTPESLIDWKVAINEAWLSTKIFPMNKQQYAAIPLAVRTAIANENEYDSWTLCTHENIKVSPSNTNYMLPFYSWRKLLVFKVDTLQVDRDIQTIFSEDNFNTFVFSSSENSNVYILESPEGVAVRPVNGSLRISLLQSLENMDGNNHDLSFDVIVPAGDGDFENITRTITFQNIRAKIGGAWQTITAESIDDSIEDILDGNTYRDEIFKYSLNQQSGNDFSIANFLSFIGSAIVASTVDALLVNMFVTYYGTYIGSDYSTCAGNIIALNANNILELASASVVPADNLWRKTQNLKFRINTAHGFQWHYYFGSLFIAQNGLTLVYPSLGYSITPSVQKRSFIESMMTSSAVAGGYNLDYNFNEISNLGSLPVLSNGNAFINVMVEDTEGNGIGKTISVGTITVSDVISIVSPGQVEIDEKSEFSIVGNI